jgi:hypothetical protein
MLNKKHNRFRDNSDFDFDNEFTKFAYVVGICALILSGIGIFINL